MPIVVTSDFRHDLDQLVLAGLTAGGFTSAPSDTSDDRLLHWLQVQHRRIPRKPRAAVWSLELRQREPSLAGKEREALRRIQAAVEAGDDLNPYLSRQLASDKAFQKHDGILNEVGIQHMHLGEGLDSSNMIKGTKNVLFVLVDEDLVRFVEVFDHRGFYEDRPFTIAQANWPQLFVRSLIPRPRAAADDLTPKQRRTLRRKNANAILVAADGSTYCPPGGGMASSGVSLNVVVARDQLLDRLENLEQWCRENGDGLAVRLAQDGGAAASALHLRFIGFDASGGIVVVDEGNRARFRFADSAPLPAPREPA